MPVMTKQLREWLKEQVYVYLRKYGVDCSVADIKAFIMEGDQHGFDLSLFPHSQTFKFINYQKNKFIEHGSLKDLRVNNGRKPMDQRKVATIIQKASLKKFTGTSRKVGAEVGVSHSTVCNILKSNGYKSIGARNSQGKERLIIDKTLFWNLTKLFFFSSLLIHCVLSSATMICSWSLNVRHSVLKGAKKNNFVKFQKTSKQAYMAYKSRLNITA